MAQWTGCIAGALTRGEYEAALARAGLVDVEIIETHRVHDARRLGDRPRAPAVTIRAARPEDAGAVAALYNAGIVERQATFETRPRAAGEIAGWFEPELPLLVAEDGEGSVVGFARVSRYSDRCVYEGVGEHGVYVDAATPARPWPAPARGARARRPSVAACTSSRAASSPPTARAAPSIARRASSRSACSAATAARRGMEGLRAGRAAARRGGRRRPPSRRRARGAGGWRMQASKKSLYCGEPAVAKVLAWRSHILRSAAETVRSRYPQPVASPAATTARPGDRMPRA